MEVIDVRIPGSCKVVPVLPGESPWEPGDTCIVQTARGIEYGTVVRKGRQVEPTSGQPLTARALRKATETDQRIQLSRRQNEQRAAQAALRRISQRGLMMKLVRVEWLFDGSKVLFYYTADGRVDFRQLVKDLAADLHCRIEMRQIGARDEAKLLGGFGCCGRPVCCGAWMQRFESISLKGVRGEQGEEADPNKLTGLCGKLRCCLLFERSENSPCSGCARRDSSLSTASG